MKAFENCACIESRIGGDISAGRVGRALVSVVQHDKVVYEALLVPSHRESMTPDEHHI